MAVRKGKEGGHARKRWRVTFKLPILIHQHSQRPMEMDTNEFTFEAFGWHPGVAVQRAFNQLRAVPELKGAIIRDCFVSVKFIEKFTKANQADLQGEPKPTTSWDDYMKTEGYKEYDIPPAEDGISLPDKICPNCKADISQYHQQGLAYTKHMVGECCIGLTEEEYPMSPYRSDPLQQTCPKCGKTFEFPEMTSVASCPHCGEQQTPN